jgi:hypothetical protein
MFSVGLSRLYGVVLFTLLIASIELEGLSNGGSCISYHNNLY